MSDLQAYLASKYLTGAKADAILARQDDGKRRKKKRRVAEDYSTTSALIVDDGGDDDWRRGAREDEEEQAMVVEARAHAGFKNIVAKTEPEPEPAPATDEAPVVVGAIPEADVKPKPKKMKGGLRLAADVAREAAEVKAEQAAQREKELRQLEEARKARGGEEEDETVVRGADGRPIDTKAAKAEEARRKRAEVEKEMQRMEWGKGLVQREDKEKRREEEAAIAAKPMARFADDADMNRQMREVERWNDPAAAFLTKKEPVGKKRGPVRPLYKGPPPPPNRFGILPGYRWDGVDRSNGFERRLAQSINERKTRTEVAHSWSVEDM